MAGRGRHARDEALFAPRWHAPLRAAVAELSWLLSRGYAEPSATKLVGDRHGLRKRQRTAVLRSACADAGVETRRRARLEPESLTGRTVALDGFNCLITTESALAGGLVIVGRDGAHRDLASVHGSYRRVATTARAIAALGNALATAAPASVTWFLDRPVSNSGRLRDQLLSVAEDVGWPWEVVLDNNPDELLAAWRGVVATSDAWILDRCAAWVDLPGAAIAIGDVPSPWLLDLRDLGDDASTDPPA